MLPIDILRMGGGAGAGVLRLDDGSYSEEATHPDTASCNLHFLTTGTLITGETSYSWLTGGAAANYDVRVTPTSGTLSSGTTGVWQRVTSNRNYQVDRSGVGEKTCTMTVEIRLTGVGSAVETATVTLTASVVPA